MARRWPIEQWSRKAISNTFAYVSQKPFVLSETILENLTYGCPVVTEDQVRIAAEKSQKHNEIIQKLDRYQGVIAEHGDNLSGGQRQPIAIARIYFRNQEIVILDEATAALNNINELAVQEALEEATQGKTVTMIAHRLSTLRHTDRIFVFDRGIIVESGSYEQVLAINGIFAQLVRIAGDMGQ